MLYEKEVRIYRVYETSVSSLFRGRSRSAGLCLFILAHIILLTEAGQ